MHGEMKQYCPHSDPGVFAAHREIIPAVLRQIREPGWVIQYQLPANAPADLPKAAE